MLLCFSQHIRLRFPFLMFQISCIDSESAHALRLVELNTLRILHQSPCDKSFHRASQIHFYNDIFSYATGLLIDQFQCLHISDQHICISWRQKMQGCRRERSFSSKYFKGAPKLKPKIIFASPTKVGENTINILNCYFSK